MPVGRGRPPPLGGAPPPPPPPVAKPRKLFQVRSDLISLSRRQREDEGDVACIRGVRRNVRGPRSDDETSLHQDAPNAGQSIAAEQLTIALAVRDTLLVSPSPSQKTREKRSFISMQESYEKIAREGSTTSPHFIIPSRLTVTLRHTLQLILLLDGVRVG